MSCSIEMLRKIVFFAMSQPWERRGRQLSFQPVTRQESSEPRVQRPRRRTLCIRPGRRSSGIADLPGPNASVQVFGGLFSIGPLVRSDSDILRSFSSPFAQLTSVARERMREKKTYSSRYVACSEAMFETGGAGVNWRNPSKTCRTLRGSAMPIGTGSDTFLKVSGVFVASRHDPKRQNSRIAERVFPSATITLSNPFRLPIRGGI